MARRPVPVPGRVVVAMLVRAPATPREPASTTVAGGSPADLHSALVGDSLDVLRRIRNIAPVVICEPAEARPDLQARVPPQMAVVTQPEGQPGALLAACCEGFSAMGARGIVVIGSATPDLPAARIRHAVEYLTANRSSVVLGPTGVGGCYLLGVGADECSLLADLSWGTADLEQHARLRAAAAGFSVFALEPWADTHTLADVDRLITRRTRAARRTRAWARAFARRDDATATDRRGATPAEL